MKKPGDRCDRPGLFLSEAKRYSRMVRCSRHQTETNHIRRLGIGPDSDRIKGHAWGCAEENREGGTRDKSPEIKRLCAVGGWMGVSRVCYG